MDDFQYHVEDGTVYQGGIQQVPPPMQQQVQTPAPAPAQVKPGINLLEQFNSAKGGRSRKRRKITKRNNRKKMKTRRYKRSKYSYKK